MDPAVRSDGHLASRIQRLCAEAPSLRRALEDLVGLLATHVGADRAVVVAELGDDRRVVGEGIGRRALAELRALLTDGAGPPRGLQGADAYLSRLEAPILEDLEPFRLVSFGLPAKRFSGFVLLEEAVADDPTAASLAEALGTAAPSFARAGELEALRRVAEEARERANHLETIFGNLPDPVVVLDQDQRILMANRRAEALFQGSADDSEGRRRAIQTNNLFFSAFRAKAVLGEDREPELLLVDPEYGEDVLCEVTVIPEGSGLHARARAVYILRDITDLKRAASELELHYRRLVTAEHRLRRETERLNVIIENAGVPILVTDDRSNIVLLNREAERLFDVGPAGTAPSPGFQSVRSNDAVLTGLISDFLLQPRERREEEVRLADPQADRAFPARVTLTKITTPRGEPTAVVSVLHDLTSEVDNQRLAEELRVLNAELEERIAQATHELAERNRLLEAQREELAEASRLKSEFLAMMSHELRTPLNSMLGYTSLLRDGVLGELEAEQVRALDKAHGASEHLLSLINDILDLSRVEAGKIALSLEEVSVERFMGNFRESVRHLVEPSPLDFRIRVEGDLPRVYVDPMRLRQVLLNLVSNAIKFTDEGFVEVRVSRDERREDRIRCEVEDTGIGIEEENLEVIFEGFRQLERFPTRAQKGTGLGLAISQKLIVLMGSRLEVRSVFGEGSLFWFTLPIAPTHTDTREA